MKKLFLVVILNLLAFNAKAQSEAKETVKTYKHTVLATAYINGSITCILGGKEYDSYTLLNSYAIKILK